MKTAIILGTSRSDGETNKTCEIISGKIEGNIFDLNDYNISYFQYELDYVDDDFQELFKEIVENYENIVFATPVYWYSMSAIMKTFFDRFSDFLGSTEELKELGKKFTGKNIFVITTSNGNTLGDAFFLPFSETAKYMGANFIFGEHILNQESQEIKRDKIDNFIKKLNYA